MKASVAELIGHPGVLHIGLALVQRPLTQGMARAEVPAWLGMNTQNKGKWLSWPGRVLCSCHLPLSTFWPGAALLITSKLPPQSCGLVPWILWGTMGPGLGEERFGFILHFLHLPSAPTPEDLRDPIYLTRYENAGFQPLFCYFLPPTQRLR